MNLPILIAGILSLIAFIAHAFIGDSEYRAIKPNLDDSEQKNATWIQARAGWHWVSVDLLFSSIALFLLATTEIIKAKSEISLLLSIYFFVCGIVWLITVLLSKNNNKQVFIIGQWIFCFLMSALIFAGT